MYIDHLDYPTNQSLKKKSNLITIQNYSREKMLINTK